MVGLWENELCIFINIFSNWWPRTDHLKSRPIVSSEQVNTSFLLDNGYVNLIKNTIAKVANQYVNNKEVDAVLLSDTMKMQKSKLTKLCKDKES